MSLHPRLVRRFAMLVLVLVVSLAPAAGWAQDRGESRNNWFRVSWQPGVLPSTIEGSVYNASPFRAIDVRLQVEGVDGANHPTGERLVWAGDDIAPGGQTSYFAESIPGAVHYRVTVVSFQLVAEDGGVANDEAAATSELAPPAP
jgi:hypothetical protein